MAEITSSPSFILGKRDTLDHPDIVTYTDEDPDYVSPTAWTDETFDSVTEEWTKPHTVTLSTSNMTANDSALTTLGFEVSVDGDTHTYTPSETSYYNGIIDGQDIKTITLTKTDSDVTVDVKNEAGTSIVSGNASTIGNLQLIISNLKHIYGVGVKNKDTDDEEVTRLIYPDKTYAKLNGF